MKPKDTPKIKAEKLIEKYSKYVNGYVGSSMLTNTEYPETIKNNAKECALIAVDELIIDYNKVEDETVPDEFVISQMQYWEEVRHQIELF